MRHRGRERHEGRSRPVRVDGSSPRLGAKEWLLVIGTLVFALPFFFKYLLSGEMLKALLALSLFVVACLVLGWARERDE
ncbi:hypothetical protein ASG95_07345 [Phycicoccus sp. Soil803]|nr:hypothetical protein ASG95_07345 [Phycicoccus sp. Soil803]